MKKLKPIAIITLALFLNSCGLKEVVGPNAEGTTNSDSYQPVTKNSTWKYAIQVAGQTALQTATMTMTGDVKTINGISYFKALEITPDTTSAGYFGKKGHIYSLLDDSGYDEPYLEDSLPAGGTFSTTGVSGGSNIAGIKFAGTILEKGIAKTIGGKTFQNVIHTRIETQSNFNNSPYVTDGVEEYYIAKGVGVIEIDAYLGTLLLAKQTIVSYNIK